MTSLKLMADYDCYPLWKASPGQVGNVNPEDLPLSTTLKADLLAWAGMYNATLNRNDPRQSGFKDEDQQEEFRKRGEELGERLNLELGPDYKVFLRV